MVESWKECAREITRGWNPSDIWNMDETGSFWQGLSGKSLSEKGKKCTLHTCLRLHNSTLNDPLF